MTTHFSLMIPGASASATLDVTAPFDGAHIATVDVADEKAIETALTTAYTLYRDRSKWLSASKRIEILEKAAQLMRERAEELAVEAAREGGKPLIDSRVEVARAIDGVRNCVECMRTETGEEIKMGVNPASEHRLAFTHHEPIGVVVSVSAFNHPLNLIVHQVGPAIAAGCPVIVKPTQDTPLSCMRFVRILREAGLPDEWCQPAVITNRDVATGLVADERVGFFSFIGSAKVGWMLRSKLAAGTRCALEHGGVAPVILEADADLDDAIPLLAKGAFYHAGQVCVSVQRVFCHESVVQQVAEGIAAIGSKMTVGDPTSADTDVGPLIRHSENDRVHEWVSEAIEQGATKLCGGEKISDSCYQPTVLLNPPADARVSTLEVFGPVICIYSYTDMDEAIARANSLQVAFQASVFTKNIDRAMRAYKNLDASAVMINDFTAFRVDWMPFAGLKHSGLGVGGIPYTFEDMQVKKLMVIRSPDL